MNIFYLSHDVIECARSHVDKHNIKMILEYCQLLSTAHRVLDGKLEIITSSSGRKAKRYIINDSRESLLYSATHINHPSAIWTRQSKQNYIWLSQLLVELCKEYTYRYGKTHKSESIGLVNLLVNNIPKNIQNSKFTQPTPAMPDEYKVPNDSIKSYRNYYNGAKYKMFSWKNRMPPSWALLMQDGA